MRITQQAFCCLAWMTGLLQVLPALADGAAESDAGPAYAKFHLTLDSGWREEAAGPFYYTQWADGQRQWALPPFFSRTRTPEVDWSEWNLFYPVIDYRRFGKEYRLQIAQCLSFSGGNTEEAKSAHGVTIFPIYFRQRSSNTNLNYTAVAPFYGHLKNRLFRDDIKFVLFPLYSETRKKDVVTDNYLYPLFDRRRGDHLTGWQVWPLAGAEHKAPTLAHQFNGPGGDRRRLRQCLCALALIFQEPARPGHHQPGRPRGGGALLQPDCARLRATKPPTAGRWVSTGPTTARRITWSTIFSGRSLCGRAGTKP